MTKYKFTHKKVASLVRKVVLIDFCLQQKNVHTNWSCVQKDSKFARFKCAISQGWRVLMPQCKQLQLQRWVHFECIVFVLEVTFCDRYFAFLNLEYIQDWIDIFAVRFSCYLSNSKVRFHVDRWHYKQHPSNDKKWYKIKICRIHILINKQIRILNMKTTYFWYLKYLKQKCWRNVNTK